MYRVTTNPIRDTNIRPRGVITKSGREVSLADIPSLIDENRFDIAHIDYIVWDGLSTNSFAYVCWTTDRDGRLTRVSIQTLAFDTKILLIWEPC